jgi:hypothetical protein
MRIKIDSCDELRMELERELDDELWWELRRKLPSQLI